MLCFFYQQVAASILTALTPVAAYFGVWFVFALRVIQVDIYSFYYNRFHHNYNIITIIISDESSLCAVQGLLNAVTFPSMNPMTTRYFYTLGSECIFSLVVYHLPQAYLLPLKSTTNDLSQSPAIFLFKNQ